MVRFTNHLYILCVTSQQRPQVNVMAALAFVPKCGQSISSPVWQRAQCWQQVLPGQHSRAHYSNVVQIPTEPRAAQFYISSQLISIDTLI